MGASAVNSIRAVTIVVLNLNLNPSGGLANEPSR